MPICEVYTRRQKPLFTLPSTVLKETMDRVFRALPSEEAAAGDGRALVGQGLIQVVLPKLKYTVAHDSSVKIRRLALLLVRMIASEQRCLDPSLL